MKRFIRYLYEYEQKSRMRNVGFVKVEKDDEHCMLHVHGKGLSPGNGEELAVYLFSEEEGMCVGLFLGTVVCMTPTLNETWSYARDEERFREAFDRINGIVLEEEGGRRFASVWEDTAVDISNMKIAPLQTEMQDVGQPDEPESGSANEREPEDAGQPDEGKADELKSESANEREMENAEEPEPERVVGQEAKTPGGQETENAAGQKTENAAGQESEPEKEEVTGRMSPKRQNFRVRRIQRMELSKLARCEWKLANNHFLMHGYYNYHHLVLLEDGNQLILGVPGIYHEKEARAAEVFGFPQFISADELEVSLHPEEKNEEEIFGYWCRPVRRNYRWE